MVRRSTSRRFRARQLRVVLPCVVAVLCSTLISPQRRVSADPDPGGAGIVPPGAAPRIGSLLVARRGLPDPNFDRTVVLLLAYGEDEGAVGVVVNRRSDRRLGEVTSETSPLAERQDLLYLGGPVDPAAMIVLLEGEEGEELAGATEVLSGVFLLSGRDAVEQLGRARVPPSKVRFFAGYAGWAPGQLEAELARGDWYVLQGEASWVFNRHPESAWEELVRLVFAPRA